MSSKLVYLALGGNLGDVQGAFLQALEMINVKIGPIQSKSKTYTTLALVAPGQVDPRSPQYLNAAVSAQTTLNASEIISTCLQIEQALGRDRSKETRWSPRAIDIDTIMLGDEIVNAPGVILPHPEFHNRDFVLKPLCDIAPDLLHPILKISVKNLLANLAAENSVVTCLVV